MAQDSTEIEQLVGRDTLPKYSELLTKTYHAELSLSFGIAGEQPSYRLLIEAPTLQAASGIFRGAYASFWTIVLQDQSSGD